MHTPLSIYNRIRMYQKENFDYLRMIHRVLLAGSMDAAATPTACGRPFVKSGDAAKPKFIDACLQSVHCWKK